VAGLIRYLRQRYQALPIGSRRRARIRSGVLVLLRWLVPWRRGQAAAERPAVADRASEGTDWLVFAVIDWHFRIQRPQHLALGLAAGGERVFYVSNELIEDPAPGFSAEQLDQNGRLFQVRLYAKGAAAIYFGAPDAAVKAQLAAGLALVRRWARIDRAITIVQHPFWTDLAFADANPTPGRSGDEADRQSGDRVDRYPAVVYDCMDFHEGFETFAPDLREREAHLFQAADLTVVSSGWLADFAARHAARVATVRNGTDYELFATPPAERFQDTAGRQIIGYYGALAPWIDVDLLGAVAAAFPEQLLMLVGGDEAGIGRALRRYPNVHLSGEVPYEQLPYYLHAFAVCLLPFRISPLTLATNPVKMYEYLAAGKPVVSVDLPEVRQCDGLIAIAADRNQFCDLIADALSEGPTAVADRQGFARRQSWAHRCEELRMAIANHSAAATAPAQAR
jgi:glycosyltransferase involved in cell wall biosynthesis